MTGLVDGTVLNTYFCQLLICHDINMILFQIKMEIFVHCMPWTDRHTGILKPAGGSLNHNFLHITISGTHKCNGIVTRACSSDTGEVSAIKCEHWLSYDGKLSSQWRIHIEAAEVLPNSCEPCVDALDAW